MTIEWKNEINKKITPDEMVNLILQNRNIVDINAFLHPPHPQTIRLSSFGLDAAFEKLLPLLQEAKKDKKMIVVYTDYDADGITGGAIMWEALHLLGFRVMPYVPDRKKEGYGFSKKGIDLIKKKFDPFLIISVDHGISAVDQIKYAQSLGIKIVITDHHSKPDLTPHADVIFHIPSLSGSGVSYMVAKAIYASLKKEISIPCSMLLTSYFDTDYLVLASIGTIADLVPLVGDSRSIVYHGLRSFDKVKRTGIKHILLEAGLTGKEITTYEVGFMIAPRINAVGRLENAIDALRLLCTHKEAQAFDLATKVGATNKRRQDLVTTAVKTAIEMVEDTIHKEKKPSKLIFLQSKTWNEGIICLIASKIVEKYNRPVIVLTKNDGFWKGSARSVGDFHITDFLRLFQKQLISVGGHKLAAGFSVDDSECKEFIVSAQKKVGHYLKDSDLEKKTVVDIKMPFSLASLSLAKLIEDLAPFGVGNPQPVFLSDVKIIASSYFGKEKNHLKLIVKDPRNPMFPIELIQFNALEKSKSFDANVKSSNEITNLVYTLDINRWAGVEKVRGRIISF